MDNDPTTPTPSLTSKPEASSREKLRALLDEYRQMTSAGDVVSLLELVTIKTKEILEADRVSIFLYDKENCELWSVISQEKKTMRFDARLGIAGDVARTGRTINVADAYEE